MTTGDKPGRAPGPAPDMDPLLELVTAGMRDQAEHRPIDHNALLHGARTGAARIHRRRRRATAAAVAAIVVLSVPMSVLGHDLIGGTHSTTTAQRPPSTQPTPPAVPPAAPGPPKAPTAPKPGPFVLHLRSSDGPALRLSFTAHTQAVAGTLASSTRPVVTASGGDPALRHRIRAILNDRIAHLANTYRARLIDRGLTDRELAQTIQVRTSARWRHTVSVILKVTDQYPDRPATRTIAVVLDVRTGAAITPQELFTNVAAVNGAVRTAIRAAAAPIRDIDQTIAALSLQPDPDGTTGALTWYPTPDGLRCTVDTLPTTAGAGADVTVPWTSLSRFLATAEN